MTTTYKILYMIALQHEYYKSLACKDFVLVPSAATQLLLKSQRLLYKMVSNKLVILVQVNDKREPLVALDASKKMVFYLSLQKPSFTSITNIGLDNFGRRRFYFTNLNQNKSGGNLFLSKKIKTYDNSIAYLPGNIADDGAGNIYECIKTTTGNALTNITFWVARNTTQYATTNDQMLFVTMIHNYATTVAATTIIAKAFAYNKTSGNYDIALPLKNSVQVFTEPAKSIQVDLSAYPTGIYKVLINTDEYMVYADDTMVYSNYFGAVEIFQHLPNTNDFALLNSTGKVKDELIAGMPAWLTYTISFANRIAIWKYITPKQTVKEIIDNNTIGKVTFYQSPALPSKPAFFQSNVPIPLREEAKKFDVKLTSAVSSEPPLAPNPNPDTTGMLSRLGDDFYCTVYLNY